MLIGPANDKVKRLRTTRPMDFGIAPTSVPRVVRCPLEPLVSTYVTGIVKTYMVNTCA